MFLLKKEFNSYPWRHIGTEKTHYDTGAASVVSARLRALDGGESEWSQAWGREQSEGEWGAGAERGDEACERARLASSDRLATALQDKHVAYSRGKGVQRETNVRKNQ